MKNKNNLGINTKCVHIGEVEDQQFKGAVSPIYMSTSYAFDNVDVKRYQCLNPLGFGLLAKQMYYQSW